MALWLRYRINVKGLDEVKKKGDKGILFLPNHPALIDPVIMNTRLFSGFHPRSLVDEKQIRTTVLKYLEKPMRVLPLPDMGITGKTGMEKVMQQIDACADALKAGDNILMYPSGRIYRSKLENLRANGGVEHILKRYPDVRIVLVRTRGLWGSSFSRAKGYQGNFMDIMWAHVKHLLGNILFFSPRRSVEIEFTELPSDFPRQGSKDEINRYLEKFYNANVQSNTYVPYYFWEKGNTRTVPEPENLDIQADTKEVPDDVRRTVYAKLHEITSVSDIQETQTLGTDLGLDSLMVAELQTWIQEEFGHQVNNPESLRTVANVLLAAIGQSSSAEPLLPIPEEWFVKENAAPLTADENMTRVTDTFLALAKENPDFIVLADQTTGAISNRKAILAIMVLKPYIEAIEGERVGIIMPACVPAFLVYMATLYAGKIPVLINWTVGARNMEACIRNSEIKHIITSQVVIERLAGRGTDFTAAKPYFIYLEEIKKNISLFHKIKSLLASKFCWSSLRKAKVQDIAAILFTSGSESQPKAVPLTHKNVIADITSSMRALGLRKDDCVIGMLPPFHSFGLLINFMMPTVANLRVAYHTNPTEGDMLARLIAAYKVTMVIGTPTFAMGILRNATKEQIQSVRMIITGAEKCPEATFNKYLELRPGGAFLEGYGITECSPVVALNRPATAKLGTVGTIIDCLEWIICDNDLKQVKQGETGMLYLRGASIFNGYLNYDGPSPFVEIDGKQWYKTGDLVQADEIGRITFMGRLKRFVKVAGEMVSLPAIEEILMKIYRTEEMPLPLAVEAQGTDALPEIILFTLLDLERDTVNQQIRAAGLSPIHNIKRIVKLKEIPLLGSGKTDYRSLKKMKID